MNLSFMHTYRRINFRQIIWWLFCGRRWCVCEGPAEMFIGLNLAELSARPVYCWLPPEEWSHLDELPYLPPFIGDTGEHFSSCVDCFMELFMPECVSMIYAETNGHSDHF